MSNQNDDILYCDDLEENEMTPQLEKLIHDVEQECSMAGLREHRQAILRKGFEKYRKLLQGENMATRSAWLIENGKAQGHGLQYLAFEPKNGMFYWVDDVHAALHMSRRKDAELLAQENEDAQRIVEHGFND
jgi:hypothetical protein